MKPKILLVEDDEELGKQIVGYLEEAELAPTWIKDGDEAIRLYQEAKEAGQGFDLVLVDLTIPGGMGGLEATEKLLAYDPGVKAIVSSGYSTDPIMAEYERYGFCGVIEKPYELEKLSKVVHEVLKREFKAQS